MGNAEATSRPARLWLKKAFRTAHTKMDFNPEVWSRVEGMILRALRSGACEEVQNE